MTARRRASGTTEVPIFNLICPQGHKRRVLRPQGWKSLDETLLCRVTLSDNHPCSQRLARDSSSGGPGALVKEVVDNGAMVKALERQADAERLHKDRVEIENALVKGTDPGKVIR
jgi:hypothetical protein